MRGVGEIVSQLEASVKAVMLGQEETVRRVISTMIAGGHVLLEDVPGTGKPLWRRQLLLRLAEVISSESNLRRIFYHQIFLG